MKWLIGCLVALFMVSSALAGEDPYIAVVGNDIDANTFYLSPKYEQFLYDQNLIGPIPTTGEAFTYQYPLIQPEICDYSGVGSGLNGSQPPYKFNGNVNSKVGASNSGYFQWSVRLPKKPVGEINLCFQCGVIKPNTFADQGFGAVQICAAETGERIDTGGYCSHAMVPVGVDPVIAVSLPNITATASPGPYADLSLWPKDANGDVIPFNLTAYRNPRNYSIAYDAATGAIIPTDAATIAASQVLNGSTGARVVLKACMDKCILVKLPVEGQINALGQSEHDLVQGDLLTVKMKIPRQSVVDVYCHKESLRVMGIGESVW